MQRYAPETAVAGLLMMASAAALVSWDQAGDENRMRQSQTRFLVKGSLLK